MSKRSVNEDSIVPPRIIHVFTKFDKINPLNQRIASMNIEIINALVKEGWIDAKIYLSSRPFFDSKKPKKGS